MTQTFQESTIEEICNVEYGTRVVIKKDAGTIYPVYGGGGETFFLDTYNRENRVVVARFAMSEKCTRRVVGKFALNDSGLTLSPKDTSVLRQDYLDYYILRLNDQIYQSARGTAQKNLDVPAFRQMKVVYPTSLEKQREIVAKLDSAFAEIDKLEENLGLRDEKATQLLQSLLSNAFTSSGDTLEPNNPSANQDQAVKIVLLRDVASFDKNQGSFNSAYIGLEDIESNTGLHLGSREPRKVKSKTFSFTSEHVLYGRLRPYLNKVLLPNFDGHCSTEIFPIRVSEKISREYLFYWFRLPSTVEAIDLTSTGARMPRANMDAVLEFEIPLPSPEKQREIVKKLDSAFTAIESMKSQIEREKNYTAALSQSLLSSAFTYEEAVA